MDKEKQPLTDDQRKLAEDNHNLIYKFARKNNVSLDEYYDLLAIGLCNAARTYDKNKGAFSTVAYRCMKNELSSYWRSINKKTSVPEEVIFSYDAPIRRDDCDGDSFKDSIPDYKAYNDMIDGVYINELTDMFDNREKKILKYAMSKLSHQEIADKINCSRASVTYYFKRMRKLANDYFSYN